MIASGSDGNLRKRDRLIKVSRSPGRTRVKRSWPLNGPWLSIRCRRVGQSTCSSLPLPYGIIGLIVNCAVLWCIRLGPRIWLERWMASRGILSPWARAASVRSKQQGGQCPSSCSCSSLSLLLPFPLSPLTHPLVAGRASDQTLSPCSTFGL